ncbi:MAG: amylosucrase, partial [Oscillospiraceae bacterium]|nr:amylosucrase [Oscillospiraceae bacterium]
MTELEKMEQRLQESYDELKWLYCELYQNNTAAFEYFLEMLRRNFKERRASLRSLDEKRLADPDWYYSNQLLGMM